MGERVSTSSCASGKRSHDVLEAFISKKPRLSPKPMSFQSDIVAKLHQAEVDVESPTRIPRQRPEREVAEQEELSCRQFANAPTSTFGDEYKKSGSPRTRNHRDDPGEQETLNAHLEHIGVEIPCAPEAVTVEENPDEEEDLEEEEDPEEYSKDE
ncbi:hypothetical protein FNV43_RR17004 [Rhamnella rubrinervis]|uniref:Uncharacterized protein n=1 Tax=Rhamnella rubrinervis TaxID=2594499 RepID=A0A8K0GZY2_9ROSA|nr:hypothetical protein FNV43_RR17004 [Rhamnella rubrinervis]